MKRELGPAWDPGESILDWTTAQVLDELSADPRFQIPSFAQQSYVKFPNNFGGAEPLASWAAGAPQNVSAKVLVGSTGVFDVRAAQLAEFRLFSGRNVRWTIIRVE
jgi:hypothetical protein